MIKNRIAGFAAFIVMACFAQNSWAAIGRVAFAAGDARIERHVGGHTVHVKAEPGLELLVGDQLQTGPNSRLQWKMADDAMVAISSNSEFVIRDYSASSAKSPGRAFYSLLKGGLRMVSGLIGKGSPDSFSLSTPTATMGIRGTIFSVYIVEVDGRPQTYFQTDSGAIFVQTADGHVISVAAGDAPIFTNAEKSTQKATDAQIAALKTASGETELQQDALTNTKVNDGTSNGTDGNTDGTDEKSNQQKKEEGQGEPPADNNAPSGGSAPRVGADSSPH